MPVPHGASPIFNAALQNKLGQNNNWSVLRQAAKVKSTLEALREKLPDHLKDAHEDL
jgi:hypothetical protein